MKAPGGASTERCAAGVASGGRVLNVLAIAAVIGVVGLIPGDGLDVGDAGTRGGVRVRRRSGTTLADVSGGGHDGSIVDATWSDSGVYGRRSASTVPVHG